MGRSNLASLIVGILLGAVGVAALAAVPPPEPQVGRYQVAASTERALQIVVADTATGDVWRLPLDEIPWKKDGKIDR